MSAPRYNRTDALIATAAATAAVFLTYSHHDMAADAVDRLETAADECVPGEAGLNPNDVVRGGSEPFEHQELSGPCATSSERQIGTTVNQSDRPGRA